MASNDLFFCHHPAGARVTVSVPLNGTLQAEREMKDSGSPQCLIAVIVMDLNVMDRERDKRLRTVELRLQYSKINIQIKTSARVCYNNIL